MALMKWREGNRAKWIGVRPGHDGEQISKGGEAVNALVTVYLVPPGKTFHLFEWCLGTNTIATGYFLLGIYDAGGAFKRILSMGFATAGGSIMGAQGSAFPPIEVAAGYSIRLFSSAAGLGALCGITGWLE